MSTARKSYTEEQFLIDVLTDGKIHFYSNDGFVSSIPKLLSLGYLEWTYVRVKEFNVYDQSITLNFITPRANIVIDNATSKYRYKRKSGSTLDSRWVFTQREQVFLQENPRSGLTVVIYKPDPLFEKYRDLWKKEYEKQYGHKWHVKYWQQDRRPRHERTIEVNHPIEVEAEKEYTRRHKKNQKAIKRYAEKRWAQGKKYRGITKEQHDVRIAHRKFF